MTTNTGKRPGWQCEVSTSTSTKASTSIANISINTAIRCGFEQRPGQRVSARGPQINEALLQLSPFDDYGNRIEWYGVTAECNLNCELPRIPSECALVSSTHDYHIEARTNNGTFVKVKQLLEIGEMGVYKIQAQRFENADEGHAVRCATRDGRRTILSKVHHPIMCFSLSPHATTATTHHDSHPIPTNTIVVIVTSLIA